MLSVLERRSYIDAVLCLGRKPARTPAAIAAGAKTRYDDFVVTHIQQTRTIHFTVGLASGNTTGLISQG
jgi:tyrosinase